jgi:predicted RNA methylase
MADIIYYLFVLAFFLVFGTMIWATLSGAPWVPTWKKDVVAAIKEIEIKPDDVVYDLGSGDGRWLFAVAKLKPAKEIIGFEISLFFYVWTRIKILFSSYPHIKVKYQDLFKVDFGQADVIFCFLLPKTMSRLEEKLVREMKPGSIFASYTFKLPNRVPVKSFKVSEKSLPIHIYKF